jgi:hypothetical protein
MPITAIYTIQAPPQSTREAKVSTIILRGLESLFLRVPSYNLHTNPRLTVLTVNPNREFVSVLLTVIKLPVSTK